jgi:hypothetical protein
MGLWRGGLLVLTVFQLSPGCGSLGSGLGSCSGRCRTGCMRTSGLPTCNVQLRLQGHYLAV